MPEYIWGRNPVLETLHSARYVKRILLAEGQREAPALAAILQEAARRHIPIETAPRGRLDQLSHGAVHQGCLAVVEARKYVDRANLTGALALVVGNESKGISRLVREHCDLLIKLPMRGHVNSLNAAVAGSIALYEVLRQREQK